MKTIGIALAALTMTVSAFGQGQINFNNRVTGAVFAPIYGVNPAAPAVRISGNANTNGGTANYTGVPLLVGSGFTASLWEGNQGSEATTFEQVGVNLGFSTSATLPGIVRLGGAVTSKHGVGEPAAYQVRAWDNKGGTITTWAAALAASQRGETGAGFSDVIGVTLTTPPDATRNLLGLQSFNLTIVPEPSLIALGALGFGALLLRRRK